ncbi:hypothetical protein ACTSKR_05175 [Chitinibacteraceae bacterium HSL-7]
MGARVFGPVVLVRPELAGRPALLAHEFEHVRQWWALAGPGLLLSLMWHLLGGEGALWGVLASLVAQAPLYLLLPRYRLWAEARAYAVELVVGGVAQDTCAQQRVVDALLAHYRVGKDGERIRAAVLEEIQVIEHS